MKAREDEPPVESGRPPLASTARLYAHCVCDTLDDVAKADVFVSHEAWKAHMVRLLPTVFFCFSFAHSPHLPFPLAPGMPPMRRAAEARPCGGVLRSASPHASAELP